MIGPPLSRRESGRPIHAQASPTGLDLALALVLWNPDHDEIGVGTVINGQTRYRHAWLEVFPYQFALCLLVVFAPAVPLATHHTRLSEISCFSLM